MKLCKLVTSWCRNFELRIALPIAMSVLSSMLMSTAQVQAQSIHNIWYVSKAPGSMPSDGRSWRSAWGELDQIVWDSVQPGDTILIDGGNVSTTYTTPLRVRKSGTASARITIKQSTSAGRNGTIIIQGQDIGIAIQNQSFVSVIGARWRGIIVENCGEAGVSVYGSGHDQMAVANLLQNIEVRKCGMFNSHGFGTGIAFGGQQLTLNQVIAHDNYQRNLKTFQPDFNDADVINLKRCWIYNNLVQSDGISLEGPTMHMTDCILGPGLIHTARVAGQSRLTANGALFINSSGSNFKTEYNHSNLIDLRNTTSFLTRLNAEAQAHLFIDVPGQYERTKINSSVVYGGAVLLKPGRVGSGNTQFRTTGNTAAISDQMVDPRFSTNVGAYPNTVSNGTLINTDFALSLGSPAAGTGARITSVRQLLGN